MRRLKKILMVHTKNALESTRRRQLKPRALHEHVPYFSQWESRELTEKIITKQTRAQDDPNWQQSGAKNPDEYASWSWNGCGMACLKMILADAQSKTIPLVELGKRCQSYGGYQTPVDDSPGLFYKPFATFVQQEFGLRAKAVPAMTITEIKSALGGGGYVMASVTPEIRFPAKSPAKRGGHLVLIIGYDDHNQVVYLHNPSGFAGTQENVAVAYGLFTKFFDHKGIIIYP